MKPPFLCPWACAPGRPCKASGGARLDQVDAQGNYKTRYLVAGGTRRVQTRQAPYTPHTFHDHGQVSGADGCDKWGWDDGAAVCADPDSRFQTCGAAPEGPGCDLLAQEEAKWRDLLAFCHGRRMTECLNQGLSDVRGEAVDVCPDSDGSLGPGQGR